VSAPETLSTQHTLSQTIGAILSVAQNLTKTNYRITIYSEKDAYEGFDIFTERYPHHIALHLDMPLLDVWQGLCSHRINPDKYKYMYYYLPMHAPPRSC